MGSFSIWHWIIVFLAIYFFFFDWRWIYDWYLIRRFVKKSTFRRWRLRIFASRLARKTTIQRYAATLETSHLFWALKLSCHTAKAKTLIAKELENRGTSASDLADWMPDPSHITVVSRASVPNSLERHRRTVDRRRFLSRIFRWLAFPAIVLLPIIIIANFTSRLDQEQAPELPVEVYALGVIALFCLSIMWLLALCAALHGRRRSLRILLLRPFGDEKMTSALRELVPNHFGAVAVTYTLSDKSYRPRIWQRALERLADVGRIAIGALLRPSRQVGRVHNERTFLNLARMAPRVVRPGLRTFLVGDQALNVKASANWWQLVVDMLMHSVDAIVMDVSHVGAGSRWEILHMSRRNRFLDCLFIVQLGYEQEGLAALQALAPGFSAARLFTYDEQGRFTNGAEFAVEFDKVIDTALRRRRSITS